jgi:hypothetical protein
MHVLAAHGTSMRVLLSTSYSAGVPLSLTWRAFRRLEAEVGGVERAIEWLATLVRHGSAPLTVNIPNDPRVPDGPSQTKVLAPEGWTQERMQGWVATMAPYLEREFGPIKGIEAEAAG